LQGFQRFLKNGSYSDLPLSIKQIIYFPWFLLVLKHTTTKYLIDQVRQSWDRINALGIRSWSQVERLGNRKSRTKGTSY
jgi:hypothetical protein